MVVVALGGHDARLRLPCPRLGTLSIKQSAMGGRRVQNGLVFDASKRQSTSTFKDANQPVFSRILYR
jgi:hypothetical protein